MLKIPVEDCHLWAATMKAILEHQKQHNVIVRQACQWQCHLRTVHGKGSGIDQLGIVTISLGQANQERVLPSHLLSDTNWVTLAIGLLDLENMNVTSPITDEQKDKTDHLMKILQDRFQQHLMA